MFASLRRLLTIVIGTCAISGITHLVYITLGGNHSSAQKAVYEYPTYDVLLAFGDSITQYAGDPENLGYLAYLSRLYQRQMDVLNRGFSGYNTTRAREIVSQVLPVTKQPSKYGLLSPIARWFGFTDTSSFMFPPVDKDSETIWPERDDTFPQNSRALRICIFFFGTNDATISSWHQHTPIEKFKDNLLYFASLLRDPDSKHYSPSTKILFITPPPVGDRMVRERARIDGERPFTRNALARKYAQVVREVAGKVNAPYVDLYTGIEALIKRDRANTTTSADSHAVDFEGYDNYLVDGVHLNKLGNQLLYRMILLAIRKNWPELEPFAPPRATMPTASRAR
ncbi:isoamyl acetate-hydrolyzing esterase [Coemansia sp. RSA 2336]|nr:isoamyl acetate-hydrolyzing esterase [Coemansia sp. RSA 2336]